MYTDVERVYKVFPRSNFVETSLKSRARLRAHCTIGRYISFDQFTRLGSAAGARGGGGRNRHRRRLNSKRPVVAGKRRSRWRGLRTWKSSPGRGRGWYRFLFCCFSVRLRERNFPAATGAE